MTPTEADARWAKEKAALLAELAPLTRLEKEKLIQEASVYRSGPDSCNSLYMGSLAIGSLYYALNGIKSRDTLAELLGRASDAQIDAALGVCANIIKYMRENPTKACPTCGSTVLAEVLEPEKPTPIDPNTGRPFGDHGEGHQAIQFALEEIDDPLNRLTFLENWMFDDLGEWPEFYTWLKGQE